MKNKKVIITSIIIVLIVALWFKIAYTDYCRVGIDWDKPNFCILVNGAKDGGSGKYMGLGYSFDIDGYLDVETGYQIDKYTFKILGISVKEDEINH
ncbi:MAG: hypothetical protein ACK5I7_08450 [Anaerotignum sp.]